eukprot:5735765-Lingulodinium_polyedra.AAC.1
MKRPVASDARHGSVLFDASQYSQRVRTYANGVGCFADLGCGQRCQSHAARVVKQERAGHAFAAQVAGCRVMRCKDTSTGTKTRDAPSQGIVAVGKQRHKQARQRNA